MKTTVDITDWLLAEAQKVARREGTTLKALTEEGLRKVLAEKKRREAFRLRDCARRRRPQSRVRRRILGTDPRRSL